MRPHLPSSSPTDPVSRSEDWRVSVFLSRTLLVYHQVPHTHNPAVLDAAAQALQANLMAVEDEERKLLNEWQWRFDFESLSVVVCLLL